MSTTSLSAGLIIRALLLENPKILGKVKKVFPLVIRECDLPYIAYRRVSLSQDVTKSGGADTIRIEVICYAKTYEESVSIAEEVRRTLEFRQKEFSDMYLRQCYLFDSSEMWADDAYIQRLIFQVKI